MGPVSEFGGNLNKQRELFGDDNLGNPPAAKRLFMATDTALERGLTHAPDQSNAKSKLIGEYLKNFQRITKGGLYIDGFAGPQSRDHAEAWTARRVLEIEPKLIRTFWLCEIDPIGIQHLQTLKERHHGYPKTRRVFVMKGDFNETVHLILSGGRLTRRAAIFALLDQRNTECHWSTVQAIAAREGRSKIEIMYFLGTAWLLRSLKTARKPERLAQIDKWWGGTDWQKLTEMNQLQVVDYVTSRFQDELGYRFATPYQIMMRDGEKKIAFHLIHATDHPEAPSLMARAYRNIVGDIEKSPVDSQKKLL